MHASTELIVLKCVKYSDSSVIVRVYSKFFGQLSLIVYGVNKRKGKFRQAFFAPGTLLDANVLYRSNKGLHSLQDIQVKKPLITCHTSLPKIAIITLICEVVQLSIKEEEQNIDLFEYLQNAILILDYYESDFSNFHLVFLVGLSRFLGFYPPISVDASNEERTWMEQLMLFDFNTMHQLKLNREVRNQLVIYMIKYYQNHLPGMGNVNSQEILRELFD